MGLYNCRSVWRVKYKEQKSNHSKFVHFWCGLPREGNWPYRTPPQTIKWLNNGFCLSITKCLAENQMSVRCWCSVAWVFEILWIGPKCQSYSRNYLENVYNVLKPVCYNFIAVIILLTTVILNWEHHLSCCLCSNVPWNAYRSSW